jgi:hypothetical protein
VEPFPSPVSVEQSSKATEDVPVKDAPANEEVTGTIITTPAVTDEQESADAGSQVIETIFPVPDSSNSAAVKLLPPAADKPLRSAADRYTKSDETSDKLREDHLSKGDINRVYAQHGSDRQKSSSSAAAHQATEISKTLIQNQGTGKFTSVIESKYSQASQLLASNIYPQYQHRASDTKSSQRLQVWPAATEAATDVESMEGVQEEKTIVEFPPPCNGITSRPQAIQQQYPPQNGLGTVESSLPKGCVHGSTQPLNDPTPPKAISTFGARTSQPVDMALFGASSNCHRLPGGFGASSGANLPTTYNQPEPMEIDHSSPSSTTITKDPFIDKTTAAQVDGINLNSDMASNTPDPTQLDPSAPKRIGNLDAIMDSILATRRYNPLRDTFDDGDDEDTASVVAQGYEADLSSNDEVRNLTNRYHRINPSTSNHGRPKFTVPCKWFMRGLCRRGAACEYKHETGRTRPGMKDDTSIASPRAVKPPLMNSPAAPRSGHRNTAAPQSGQLGRAQRTPRNKSGNPSSNDRLAYSLPPRPSTYTNRDRLNNSMKQSGGFGAARSAPSSTRFSQSPLAQPSQATLYMQSNKPSSLKMRNHRNSKRSNDAHPAPYTAGTSMSTLPAHERHQNDRLNRDRRNSNGGDHRNTVENGFHDQKHPSKTRDNPPRRSQKSELSVGQDSRPREPQNKHDECGPHSVNKNKSSIAPSGPSQWQEKHSAAQPQGLVRPPRRRKHSPNIVLTYRRIHPTLLGSPVPLPSTSGMINSNKQAYSTMINITRSSTC